VLRATKIAEETGIPGVAIVATGFMKQAGATARAMGVPNMSIAEYPGVIPMDSADVLADKVWNAVVPAVVQKLTSDAGKSEAASAEPAPRDIVFNGTLDEVQEYFDDREWSDGLPIVPPTPERVKEFLAWTERDPAEVIGVLPPEFREATVWSVAVNGVMSGCRPEYMPILLGIVDAISDPDFRMQDAGATPGWEPLVVVSGEIVDALKYNTEVANMRVGRRANSSIGRFLRMYMRNVAGFRPGTTDKGSIGFTFNVSMGENEGAVKELGWDPLRVDLGFAREDNVVMVQSVLAVSAPVYSGGTDPVTLARPLVRYLAGAAGPWNFTALWFSRWHPLIQMSPAVAKGFKDLGWGKKEIRDYLFEHTRISARWMEHYPLAVGGQEMPLADVVKRGAAPALYADSNDPDRLLPMLLKPEWTNIVVAGDPGRNQSRIYVNNHEQGPPVARKIALPKDWRERLKRR
jgi:hypothetical protein